MARRSTPPCVFCGEPSSRKGEHALPKWFRERWLGDGPFTYEISGIPVLTRNGLPRRTDHLPPDLLPVCDATTSANNCNGTLNRLYEVSGKPVVRAVLDRSEVLETPAQVTDFARWWVKTLLLLYHPNCRNAFEGIERPAWDLPASVYKQLLSGVLPSEASLWLAVTDDVKGREQLPELMRIYLPTTFSPEGGGGKPSTVLAGFTQEGTRILQVQMLVHPLLDLLRSSIRNGWALSPTLAGPNQSLGRNHTSGP
jgi:hypothetical protein